MNPTPAIYVKIDKMIYKGKEVFYRKPINTDMHLATEFSKNYEYYYKEDTTKEPKYLGNFIEFRMYRSSPYFDEYILFEKKFR